MPKRTQRPTLYIVMFSNFEGFCASAEEATQIVKGFTQITKRHPEAVWTHMFNPVHLLGSTAKRSCENAFVPYLLSLIKKQPATEVGLHLHLFHAIAEALGGKPRSYLYASAPVGKCGQRRGLEGDGYDVLLTGYSNRERAQLIEGCVAAYERAGLPRPTSFCAGYSATDPALQALLEKVGFTTSFAAQTVPPGIEGVSYPPCWYKLLEWGENMTPLSRPYRVPCHSILPLTIPAPLLDRLVEIPLNTDTDVRPPYLFGERISRKNILDYHYSLVKFTGRNSCVALGLHDVYLGEKTAPNAVIEEMTANLDYVRTISKRGDVDVRYATASQVSQNVYTEPKLW